MGEQAFDAEAFSRWIAELRLEELQLSPPVFQVFLREDAAQDLALAELATAFDDALPAPNLVAWEILKLVCETCRDITLNHRRHPCARFIREHFTYHDQIVKRLNGAGLCDVFAPFVLRASVEETARTLCTCLKEFILHIANGLRERGFLGRDPSAPKARPLIVNGFYRTGSTKVFLAAQAILKVSGREYLTTGADVTMVDEILDEIDYGAFRGKWVLIKTHYWMPVKKRENLIVFFTRRNLADVAASHYRRLPLYREQGPDGLSEEIIAQMSYGTIASIRMHHFINEYVVPKYDMHVIDYEDFWGRDRDLLIRLSKEMGFALSPQQLEACADFISVERVKAISDALADSADPKTFIQSNHVSKTLGQPGGGIHEMPKRVIDDLRQFGLWPAGN